MTDEQQIKFVATGAPKRHRRWTAEGKLSGTCQYHAWYNTFTKVHALYGTGFLVALCGPRGTGKSQIGVELIRHAIEQEDKALYIRAMDLFIDLKSTYGSKDRAENERTVLDRLLKPNLLVIDELSEGSDSEFERRMLTYLIDVRYGEAKDTLLIANYTRQTIGTFEQRVGDSCVSRLNETGGILWCDWASFRE